MRFVLLGAPGSGKGVQAKKLCETYKIPHISTGDIFREEIASATPLGMEVKNYVSNGQLVPDSLVMKTVIARLDRPDCARGFLLDGIPRTVEQAKQLDAYLKEKKFRLDRVIYLKVDTETLVNRLTGRRQCQSCNRVFNVTSQPPKKTGVCDDCGANLIQRVDDRTDTVRKRLTVYEDLTEPLVSYYLDQALLADIDGAKDPAVVAGLIAQALESQNAKR